MSGRPWQHRESPFAKLDAGVAAESAVRVFCELCGGHGKKDDRIEHDNSAAAI